MVVRDKYALDVRWRGPCLVVLGLFGATLLNLRDSQSTIQHLHLNSYYNQVFDYLEVGTAGSAKSNVDNDSSYDFLSAKSQLSDKDFDLIFWTNETVDTIQPYLVARDYRPKDKFAPVGQHILKVDFRSCGMDCESILSTQLSPSQLNELWQHSHYNHPKLKFYQPNSSLLSRQSQTGLLVATFWSEVHQQHVPIRYSTTQIKPSSCSVEKCPRPCPQNLELEPTPYPYIRDEKDGVCKSPHPSAIPPNRAFGGACRCESTCYTPEATALNTTWPWKDEAEREYFRSTNNSSNMRRQCEAARRKKNQMSSYEARFPCSVRGNISLPCPIYGDFLHHLYFIPRAKLIFCGIPKVGVTEWIKFFRYVIGANDYLSLPHYKQDRESFHLRKLDISKAQTLLNDPTWTRAVFLRNPLDRFLSAYMDKIVGQAYTQKIFKIGDLDEHGRPVLTFPEFVEKVSNFSTISQFADPMGLKASTDPHWKPQIMTCGLDYWLPQVDFIGNFDHIAEHTKLLLEKVGLWEDYGSKFDDGRNVKMKEFTCWVPPVQRNPNETVWGFNQRGPSGSGKNVHATGSKDKFEKMYTPELVEKLRKAYALDFAVWDQISSEDLPSNKVLSGRDLDVVREHCKVQQTKQ